MFWNNNELQGAIGVVQQWWARIEAALAVVFFIQDDWLAYVSADGTATLLATKDPALSDISAYASG